MKDQRVPWEVEGARDAPSEPALEYETRGKQKRGFLHACVALASTPYLIHISIILSLESCHLEASAVECKSQTEQPRVSTRTNVANSMPRNHKASQSKSRNHRPCQGGGEGIHRLTEGGRKCGQQGIRQDANPASTYRCCLGMPWKAVEYTSPGLRQQR